MASREITSAFAIYEAAAKNHVAFLIYSPIPRPAQPACRRLPITRTR